MLNPVMLNDIMLIVVMLNVIILSVVMPIVVVLSVIRLSVVMLSVIMPSVVTPRVAAPLTVVGVADAAGVFGGEAATGPDVDEANFLPSESHFQSAPCLFPNTTLSPTTKRRFQNERKEIGDTCIRAPPFSWQNGALTKCQVDQMTHHPFISVPFSSFFCRNLAFGCRHGKILSFYLFVSFSARL